MTRNINVFLSLSLLIAVVLVISGSNVRAQENPAVSKEGFLAAWEEHQKSLPTTVKLEKTAEPGVYSYETTLFPYKGNLEVLNVVISNNIDYYSDYDLNLETELKGVAEIKLPDLPADSLYEIYPYSDNIWDKNNFLFFHKDSEKWLSADEWREVNPPKEPKYSACAASDPYKKYKELAVEFMPLLLLLLFLAVVLWFTRKAQKGQIAKYDLSMERQKQSIEKQEHALAMAEESLKVQKEQINLLRQLLDKG